MLRSRMDRAKSLDISYPLPPMHTQAVDQLVLLYCGYKVDLVLEDRLDCRWSQ